MILSICIPTYNRGEHLENCLTSIFQSGKDKTSAFQVCISDNCSSDNTQDIVRSFKEKLPIKYVRNSENLGRVRNYLQCVSIAEGEYVWLLGDDDLLMSHTVSELTNLLSIKNHVDFFYVNSCHLDAAYLDKFSHPFSIEQLPEQMDKFSSWKESAEQKFLDLIHPRKSFDFLGGMFLAVFRRKMWLEHADVLDKNATCDSREFSHIDNTFPHIHIFAAAFSQSTAYFHAMPLSVNLTGVREWSPMYPLVQSVRLIEVLEIYRQYGLSNFKFIRCKNFALRYFIPDLIKMLKYKTTSGWSYVTMKKHILKNILYPNVYLSPFIYIFTRLRR
jgi:glycosyltransferase involved in cell wall biosynthesis